MGRPKGSKNKPKVTTALVGEVINKPIKKTKEVPLHLLDDTVTDPDDLTPTNGDKMVSEGAPVLSDDDINAATLKEAQQVVTRRRKLSVKDKNIEDKLDFLFKEVKHLREYISRLETILNVSRSETNEPEPIVKKRRGRALTTTEHHDKLDPVENKETVNETE